MTVCVVCDGGCELAVRIFDDKVLAVVSVCCPHRVIQCRPVAALQDVHDCRPSFVAACGAPRYVAAAADAMFLLRFLARLARRRCFGSSTHSTRQCN